MAKSADYHVNLPIILYLHWIWKGGISLIKNLNTLYLVGRWYCFVSIIGEHVAKMNLQATIF